MKHGLFIQVMCDACCDEVININLHGEAGPHSLPEYVNVDQELATRGWKKVEGEDLCPECAGIEEYVEEYMKGAQDK
jgi:hypothetical protein